MKAIQISNASTMKVHTGKLKKEAEAEGFSYYNTPLNIMNAAVLEQ